MLVPGLPITDLAIEAVVANHPRRPVSVAFGSPSIDLRDAARAWQARILFAACYAFVVGVVVMAG